MGLSANEQRIFEETLEKVRVLAAKLKAERLGRFTTAYVNTASNSMPVARPRQTVEVHVSVTRASLVVGPQGETLKRLEKMSGASIQLDQAWSANEQKRFLVTGFPEDIEEAKRLIIDKPLNFSSYPSMNISVPQVRVGLIIGKGGETIREIQEKSGAKVVIAPDLAGTTVDGRRDMDRERIVTVMGEEAAIEKAKEMIEEIVFGVIRSGASAVLSTIRNSAIMQIPDTATGTVIGKRAETMKGIQEVSKAKLFVDPNPIPGTNLRNVYLSGTPEAMAIAQSLIGEKVRRVDPTFGLSYDYSGALYSAAPVAAPACDMHTIPPDQQAMDYAAYYAQYYGMDPSAYAAYCAQYVASVQMQGGDQPAVDPAYYAQYAQYSQQQNQ